LRDKGMFVCAMTYACAMTCTGVMTCACVMTYACAMTSACVITNACIMTCVCVMTCACVIRRIVIDVVDHKARCCDCPLNYHIADKTSHTPDSCPLF